MASTNQRCDRLARKRSENMWRSPMSFTKLWSHSSRNAKLRPNSNRKLSSSNVAKGGSATDRRFEFDKGESGVADRSINRRSSSLKSPYCSCVLVTLPSSSNTRMIAWCERQRERYFAYATAQRTASGPAYQIGPYRSRSLIRSKPSRSLRGRIS